MKGYQAMIVTIDMMGDDETTRETERECEDDREDIERLTVEMAMLVEELQLQLVTVPREDV